MKEQSDAAQQKKNASTGLYKIGSIAALVETLVTNRVVEKPVLLDD
jgi:hypothetical protein